MDSWFRMIPVNAPVFGFPDLGFETIEKDLTASLGFQAKLDKPQPSSCRALHDMVLARLSPPMVQSRRSPVCRALCVRMGRGHLCMAEAQVAPSHKWTPDARSESKRQARGAASVNREVPGEDTFRRRSTLPALVEARRQDCINSGGGWRLTPEDTNTQALMLARQLQLDFHEVARRTVRSYVGVRWSSMSSAWCGRGCPPVPRDRAGTRAMLLESDGHELR